MNLAKLLAALVGQGAWILFDERPGGVFIRVASDDHARVVTIPLAVIEADPDVVVRDLLRAAVELGWTIPWTIPGKARA